MISRVPHPGLCDTQHFYRNKPIAAEPQAGTLAMCLRVQSTPKHRGVRRESHIPIVYRIDELTKS